MKSSRRVVNLVVFACTHNAGRSQMAAAFFNRIADPGRAVAVSAGTNPASRVHPEVVAVMREADIDLSDATPRLLTTQFAAGASHLITMGCGEACPYLPGVTSLAWPIEDPKGRPVERVREIRDEILNRVQDLAATNGWSRRD
jgi:arsenate reductase (thioredoxin)